MAEALSDPDQNKLAQTWMNDNTLNKWRHDRMLGLIPSTYKSNHFDYR